MVAEARTEFDTASIALFQGALHVAKQLRPAARWGFYNMLGDHSGAIDTITLKALPIWKAQTAIFPSLYMNVEYNFSQETSFITSRVNASVALAKMISLPTAKPVPVYPFVMQMKDGPGNPLLTPTEIALEFFAPYDLGASGVIVFNGNLSRSNTADLAYWNHTMHVLGPAVHKFLQRVDACATRHCNGHGRCASSRSSGPPCECFVGFSGPACGSHRSSSLTSHDHDGENVARAISLSPMTGRINVEAASHAVGRTQPQTVASAGKEATERAISGHTHAHDLVSAALGRISVKTDEIGSREHAQPHSTRRVVYAQMSVDWDWTNFPADLARVASHREVFDGGGLLLAGGIGGVNATGGLEWPADAGSNLSALVDASRQVLNSVKRGR